MPYSEDIKTYKGSSLIQLKPENGPGCKRKFDLEDKKSKCASHCASCSLIAARSKRLFLCSRRWWLDKCSLSTPSSFRIKWVHPSAIYNSTTNSGHCKDKNLLFYVFLQLLASLMLYGLLSGFTRILKEISLCNICASISNFFIS